MISTHGDAPKRNGRTALSLKPSTSLSPKP